MLAGVLFRELDDGSVQPEYVSRWIETDIWKATQEYGIRGKKGNGQEYGIGQKKGNDQDYGIKRKDRNGQEYGLTRKSSHGWGRLTKPITPSITTLVNPATSFFIVLWAILRTLYIVLYSRLPCSKTKIKRISVANTGIYHHDGRALATCESGPPIRVQLPELETVGWFNGIYAEGEQVSDDMKGEFGFGGSGPLSFMREFTTGHPKIDIDSGEMLLFHNILIAPYVQYSIIPPQHPNTLNEKSDYSTREPTRILNVTVPGVSSPKLMHDFGVSASHTVILDLPLSLDPLNLLRGKPIVCYDPSQPSRFGVFPRRSPEKVVWFEDDPCVIFHTASTWDEYDDHGEVAAVCMLACRMTSPAVVYSAGNLPTPAVSAMTMPWRHPEDVDENESAPRKRMGFFQKYDDDETHPPRLTSYGTVTEDQLFDMEQNPKEPVPISHPLLSSSPNSASNLTDPGLCALHYFRFPLSSPLSSPTRFAPRPSHSFPLSALPLEFPTTAPGKALSQAEYVYACSSTAATFTAALGNAVKIDIVAKIHAPALITRGLAGPGRSKKSVDARSAVEILAGDGMGSREREAIQLFQLPPAHYAQEPRFVPAQAATAEDDGHLLFFVFDEAQLSADGSAPGWAVSELWILDAVGMTDVVARVRLGHRVPYGLHGEFFDKGVIRGQRGWKGAELEREEKSRLILEHRR
jgi:carotenoid cleavage dioxygenase-like enzyme